MNPTEIRLLTAREAAVLLRVAPARVYDLVRQNLLPAARLGRHIRIDRERLSAFLNAGGQGLAGGWRRDSR